MNGIEHGKQNPTPRAILAIADVHHIKISRLFALAVREHSRRC
jgi:hypothetical protein